MGGDTVTSLLSISGLRLDIGGSFRDGVVSVLAWVALGGATRRGFTILVDMGGSMEGPYTKRWILIDSALVFSINVLGLLDPGLTGMRGDISSGCIVRQKLNLQRDLLAGGKRSV